MIPQKLRLKNFLSYQQLALDFSGLHVACICGANGAGKSSLLEAIAWAVWGMSRTNGALPCSDSCLAASVRIAMSEWMPFN